MSQSAELPESSGDEDPTAVPPPETSTGDASSSRRWQVWGAVAVIAVAIAAYAEILYYMVIHWKNADDYSHGFVVVPLALYFAWERKHLLAEAPIRGSWWGVAPLAIGLCSMTLGRLGVELTTMRWGFVFTLIGLVLLLLGRRVFLILIFPLLFLFMMVPLPVSLVNVIAFPLQLIAASGAVEVLHALEIPALLEGNIIHLARTKLFVAEACSGLRSLMALITLGLIFAYFFRKSLGERVLILASTIPIAIFVNGVRVTLTGILTHHFGEAAARGVIHEFQGLTTFGLAFLLLMAEASLLARIWPERWRSLGAGGP
jgi:exosortase